MSYSQSAFLIGYAGGKESKKYWLELELRQLNMDDFKALALSGNQASQKSWFKAEMCELNLAEVNEPGSLSAMMEYLDMLGLMVMFNIPWDSSYDIPFRMLPKGIRMVYPAWAAKQASRGRTLIELNRLVVANRRVRI